jgi:hypothetical protein
VSLAQIVLCYVAAHSAALSGIESVEVVAYGRDGFLVCIYKVTVRRAAGQCLDAQRAGTGKQVETLCSLKMGPQPIEECLPNPVSRGSQAWPIRKLEFPPTPLSTNDPELGGSLFGATSHAGSCFSGC